MKAILVPFVALALPVVVAGCWKPSERENATALQQYGDFTCLEPGDEKGRVRKLVEILDGELQQSDHRDVYAARSSCVGCSDNVCQPSTLRSVI